MPFVVVSCGEQKPEETQKSVNTQAEAAKEKAEKLQKEAKAAKEKAAKLKAEADKETDKQKNEDLQKKANDAQKDFEKLEKETKAAQEEVEKLEEETSIMAQKIAAQAPIAVQYAKKAINTGMDTDIESGIDIETNLFAHCFTTKDQKNGMKAFLKREKTTFEGK